MRRAAAAGVGERVDGALEGVAGGVVAVLQQRADGVVDHLDDDVGRLVVLVDRAVHEGHALVDAAGQLELEVGQPVVADAAAEAHDGRLADVRALGQLAHRQAREAARIGQHQLGHALLGRRQRRRCEARMRSSMCRRRLYCFLGPREAVARHQRAGRRRAPGAGRVRPRAAAVALPGSQDRLDPAPGLLLLVAAHEQVQPAGDRIEQQALVGADAFGREGLVEVEVERTPATAPRCWPVPLAASRCSSSPSSGCSLITSLFGAVRAREDRVRHRPEVDDDLRIARGQPLAGAQVERHAGPAPVLHLGAQRDEGLASAARRHLRPPRDSPAPAWPSTVPRAVLAAHHVARDALVVNGFSERSTFSFSSRIASASLRRRAAPSRSSSAAAAHGSGSCRAARRCGRRSRRACRRRGPRPA